MLDAIAAARANAIAHELARGVSVGIDVGLLVREDVMHLNLIAFHAGDLADAGDFALAAGQSRSLDD